MSTLWSDPVHIEIAVLVWVASVTLGMLSMFFVARWAVVSVKRLLSKFLDVETARHTKNDRDMSDFIKKVEAYMSGSDAAIYTMNERLNTMSARQDMQSDLMHRLEKDVSTLQQHIRR